MGTLQEANLAGAPDHKVLDAPYSYDIVELRYIAATAPYGTLDLTLEKDGVRLVLRFIDVHELQADPGFPYACMGLEILDISGFGWEHARIRVGGFDGEPGIRFWARDVHRLEG